MRTIRSPEGQVVIGTRGGPVRPLLTPEKGKHFVTSHQLFSWSEVQKWSQRDAKQIIYRTLVRWGAASGQKGLEREE